MFADTDIRPSLWRPNIVGAGIDRGEGTSPCCQMSQAAPYRMISSADQLYNDRCSIVLQTRSLHGTMPLQPMVANLLSNAWNLGLAGKAAEVALEERQWTGRLVVDLDSARREWK